MIKNWNYDHRDYVNGGFKPIAPGIYRVRIHKAEEQVSKSGRDMIKMTLDVSGQPGHVFHYIVFMPEYREHTNKNLGDVFESFEIERGNLELLYWIGRVGAAEIGIETVNGKDYTRVLNFIPKEEQGGLPAWEEPNARSGGGGVIIPEMANPGGVNADEESDVPF